MARFRRAPASADPHSSLQGHSQGIKIFRYDGQHIVDQIMVPLKPHDGETAEEIARREEQEKQLRENPAFDAHRGDLVCLCRFSRCRARELTSGLPTQHQTLLDYALSVGVEVKQGINVSAYEESATGASVIVNGEKHTADCVIGADGEHPLAWNAPMKHRRD